MKKEVWEEMFLLRISSYGLFLPQLFGQAGKFLMSQCDRNRLTEVLRCPPWLLFT